MRRNDRCGDLATDPFSRAMRELGFRHTCTNFAPDTTREKDVTRVIYYGVRGEESAPEAQITIIIDKGIKYRFPAKLKHEGPARQNRTK